MKNRVDLQQEITNQIIADIEQGNVLPWSCPWNNTSEGAMPFNWFTKQPYSGINILILWRRAMKGGFHRNAWLTFKQAQQLGGSVRKGEKGVKCVFAKPVEVKNKDNGASNKEDESDTKVYLCYRSFTLFNVDQVDDLPDVPEPVQPEYSDSDCVAAIDLIADAYCAEQGVTRKNGGNAAYYSPCLDMIVLPTSFHTGSDYAATLAHEMIHSTGHKSRLNRFDEHTEAFKTFNEAYAFEELVAELGASFLCSDIGIKGQHSQHVSYINGWLKKLRSDKTFIFKAASAASKAFTLIQSASSASDEKTKAA